MVQQNTILSFNFMNKLILEQHGLLNFVLLNFTLLNEKRITACANYSITIVLCMELNQHSFDD